jgi:hypothetical protein
MLEHSLEWVLVPPLRMPGRQSTDAIEGKKQLNRESLFALERFVVKNSDPLLHGNEVWTAFRLHAVDEIKN